MNENTPGFTPDNVDGPELSEVIATIAPVIAPIAYTRQELWGMNPADMDPARFQLFLESLGNDIDASDSRLTHIWERAAELANERNYCDVFDSFMGELGTGFTRSREYYVNVVVTLEQYISVPVTCHVGDDPRDHVEQWMINEYLEFAGEPEIQDWSAIDYDLAD